MADSRDLRLVVPALALWAGAWVAPLVDPVVVLVMAASTVGVAGLGRRRLHLAARSALVMLAVGAAAMGVRIAQLEAEPFAEWTTESRYVDAVGVLVSDPELVDRASFGGAASRQVRAELRLSRVTSGTETIRLRVPVLVVGDGSGWEHLRMGDALRVQGSLRPAPRERPVAAYLFTEREPGRVAEASLVSRGAESMRRGLRDAVAGRGADVEGLLPALVVGDTSALPPLLVADLRDSGLAHLTAVSGANVAIVVGAGLLLARWTGVRGYALVGLGLLLVAWFVLLARPQPSVLRAAVMGSVALVGVAVAGRGQATRALLASVVLLLLVDPWLARSWGFALSVAATAGLVLLARRWSAVSTARVPRLVRDAVAVALAAQVATLPLVVALSGQVALLSVLANLLAAPAVAPATVLGAAAAVTAPFAPSVAAGCAWLAQWPTAWIAQVAHSAASAPLATVPWPDGWAGASSAVLLLALGAGIQRLGARHRWWRPRSLTLIGATVIVLVAALLLGPGRWPPPGWVLVACDVGQGDALVVPVADGSAVVVDAGPDPALVDRCLDRLGIEQVPLLVLTHFHADHVGGMPGVLGDREVGTVLVSPLRDPPEQVTAVAGWTRGLDVVEAVPGQTGQVGEATWRVLWPDDSSPTEGSAANNASVVLVVEVSGVRMLLTGDIEPEAQATLLATSRLPRVDVLKVPHHGSRNQDLELLMQTRARVALVSVGDENTYGHPDPGLLAELASAGMLVARTDHDGTVAVLSGDGGLRVASMP